MAKIFSVASWNIEHFKNNPARIDLVINFMREQKADVFALYEVESSKVYSILVSKMPDYHFHITEGPQTQEILVGVKKTLTSFFTQKVEFKSGNTYLRPGALLTIRKNNKDYPILFLHTKSSSKPIGLGLRDDMFERAFKFKRYLDKIYQQSIGSPANFIFLGDLNTMGMKYPFKREIIVDFELKKLDKGSKSAKMTRLKKDQPFTWWNGPGSYQPANLDHVIASDHLKFKTFRGSEIDVRGWVNENTDKQKTNWIKKYSDHSLLFFQVEKS